MNDTEHDAGEFSAINLDSTIQRAKDEFSSDLEGETVILHIGTGSYYSLNSIGTKIWQLLGEPRKVAAVRDTILRQYDVSEETCTADLLKVLQEFLQAGLIELR